MICFILSVRASGPGPFPGLLDVWGVGGGLMEYRAALLGSHGYASMALEYLNPAEVNTAELELNYFEVCFGYDILLIYYIQTSCVSKTSIKHSCFPPIIYTDSV